MAEDLLVVKTDGKCFLRVFLCSLSDLYYRTETEGSRKVLTHRGLYVLVQVSFNAFHNGTVWQVQRPALGDSTQHTLEQDDGGGFGCSQN